MGGKTAHVIEPYFFYLCPVSTVASAPLFV